MVSLARVPDASRAMKPDTSPETKLARLQETLKSVQQLQGQLSASKALWQPLMDTLVAAGLELGTLRITPATVELAGTVASSQALSLLTQLALPDGMTLKTAGVRVVDAPALSTLPELTRSTGSLELHAVEAPVWLLRLISAERLESLLVTSLSVRWTGRAAVKSRAELVRALQLAHPKLAAATATVPSTSKNGKGGGKGPRVSLNFIDAQVSTVAEVLGAVLKQNVTVPGSLPTLSVAVRNEPADSVLQALARVSGTRLVLAEEGWWLVPSNGVAPAPAPEGEKSLHFWVDRVEAALAASLLSEGAKVPLQFACGAGTPLSLRHRSTSAARLKEAIQFASGAEPVPEKVLRDDSCLPVRWIPSGTESLVGVTLEGALQGPSGALALIRMPDGKARLIAAAQGEGFRVEVTAGEVRVQTDGQADQVIERRSQALQVGEESWGSWGSYRLMATLVDPRGGVALLEDRRGRVRVVRAGGINSLGIQFEIRPGRLSVKRQLRDYTGRLVSEASELRLRPWP